MKIPLCLLAAFCMLISSCIGIKTVKTYKLESALEMTERSEFKTTEAE
ncbi:hypothetical protein N8552_01220 [bacterium]|nr:hypothetical protein [bacterium]